MGTKFGRSCIHTWRHAMLSLREREAMLERAETAILQHTVTPMSTAELVQELRKEGIGSYYVRAGVLFLLDRGEISPGEDRKLVLSGHSPAAAGVA
jgi:hypothetical protein